MGRMRETDPNVLFMQQQLVHVLTDKPDSVSVEDWWLAVLQVHVNDAILAIEAEKWRLPLPGAVNEPRLAFQAAMRVGIVGLTVTEYYRTRVSAKWYRTEGSGVDLLPVKHTLRHLAVNGLLPDYCECEPRCEGRCVNL